MDSLDKKIRRFTMTVPLDEIEDIQEYKCLPEAEREKMKNIMERKTSNEVIAMWRTFLEVTHDDLIWKIDINEDIENREIHMSVEYKGDVYPMKEFNFENV